VLLKPQLADDEHPAEEASQTDVRTATRVPMPVVEKIGLCAGATSREPVIAVKPHAPLIMATTFMLVAMADPISLASVGSLVLSEGVKFLFNEAGELLRRWRHGKTSPDDAGGDTGRTVALVLPAAFGGGTLAADVDFARVEPVAERLLQLRGALSNYVDGVSEVNPEDRTLLRTADDLRGLLEELLGQRLTLAGENRPASRTPIVRSTVRLGTVEGEATGVDVDAATAGIIASDTTAQEVKRGGRVISVRIGTLGQRPSER
jgi:hypothetical protein